MWTSGKVNQGWPGGRQEQVTLLSPLIHLPHAWAVCRSLVLSVVVCSDRLPVHVHPEPVSLIWHQSEEHKNATCIGMKQMSPRVFPILPHSESCNEFMQKKLLQGLLETCNDIHSYMHPGPPKDHEVMNNMKLNRKNTDFCWFLKFRSLFLEEFLTLHLHFHLISCQNPLQCLVTWLKICSAFYSSTKVKRPKSMAMICPAQLYITKKTMNNTGKCFFQAFKIAF